MKRRASGPGISFFAFQDIITAVVGIFILITLILVLELTQRVEAASSRPTGNAVEIQATLDSLGEEISRVSVEYEERLTAQEGTATLNRFNRDAKIGELTGDINAAKEQIRSTKERLQKLGERIDEENKVGSDLLIQSQKLEQDRDLIADLKGDADELDRTIQQLTSDDGMIYRDETADGRSLCILTLGNDGIVVQDALSRSKRSFTNGDWIRDFSGWVTQIDGRHRHFLLLVRPSGVTRFDAIRKLFVERGHVYGFDVVAEDHRAQLAFQWEPRQ